MYAAPRVAGLKAPLGVTRVSVNVSIEGWDGREYRLRFSADIYPVMGREFG